MLTLLNLRNRRQANGSGGRSSPDGASASSSPRYDASALEALVQRAERAAAQLRSLEPTAERAAELAAMEERIAGLERQIATAEQLRATLAATEGEAARLGAVVERANAEIAAAGSDVERVRASFVGLAEKVDAALSLGDELGRFVGLQGPFHALRAEAETITTQMRDLAENVGRLRTLHDDAMRAHKHAAGRLDGIDERHQETAGKMDVIERRAAAAEQALDAVVRLASGIPDVHHQLGVLRAIADQVAQKTALLEQQREAVERAAGQASHVLELTNRVDGALRRQDEQARVLSALDARLAEVQSLHATVQARGDEIAGNQRQLDEAEREAARALADLRGQMHASVERFELENRSLDAVSERIAELRVGVKECEGRFATLEAASQTLAETESRGRTLASQVADIAYDVSRIGAQAERLRAVRDDVGQLDRALVEMAERVQRVEDARPTLEVVARDLATLSGAHEAISDGLEQVRVAYSEMTRLREKQAETEAWLAHADLRTRTLQGQVEELESMRPSVEALRLEVDHLAASTGAIEARGTMVDDLHRRLSELESTVGQLHERSDGVRARMDAAETRFTELARQAAEAQRIAATIASVSAAVEAAERRMGGVGDALDTLESRAQKLDGLDDRVRLLGQELEQRQGALDKAAEHLAQASTVRREAADAAQRLEAVTRDIAAQLDSAEARGASLEQLSIDLDGRAASLGDVGKRIGQLEGLLARWEVAQGEAAHALEQIGSRQAMIDAVQAQVSHVFDLAERTVENVRSIGAARRAVEETRAFLEGTREQLKSATEAMRDFAERKRQVEEIEKRLARADALAMGVRTSVEVIAAQRSVVDQVLERSGTLTFQMRQAEALLEALRTERTLATELRAAVENVE